MVNATTLTRVKSLIGYAGNENDTLLSALIESVSREIEGYIGYEIEKKQRTEFYSPELNCRRVFLTVVPVESVDEVVVAREGSWDFAGATALTAGTHYRLRGLDVGEILFTEGALIFGFETLRIKYTAGISATDIATGAVALAADHQVAEEFRRRNNPMTQQRPGPSKTTKTYTDHHQLMPRVRELLQPYRRYANAI